MKLLSGQHSVQHACGAPACTCHNTTPLSTGLGVCSGQHLPCFFLSCRVMPWLLGILQLWLLTKSAWGQQGPSDAAERPASSGQHSGLQGHGPGSSEEENGSVGHHRDLARPGLGRSHPGRGSHASLNNWLVEEGTPESPDRQSIAGQVAQLDKVLEERDL